MRVVKRKVFHDERWTQNRAVNAMDWSAHVSHMHMHATCIYMHHTY